MTFEKKTKSGKTKREKEKEDTASPDLLLVTASDHGTWD